MRDFRVAHGATELLLIRHAEAEGITLSEAVEPKDVDLPLTQRGRAQAAALATRLAQATSRRSMQAHCSARAKPRRQSRSRRAAR